MNSIQVRIKYGLTVRGRDPVIVGDDCIIKLSKGKYAVCDAEDAHLVKHHKWTTTSDGYAAALTKHSKNKNTQMHRILCESDKPCVDHIDHDKLNNRKSNLRGCNHSENGHNRLVNKNKASSQYKGVFKSRERWRARLKINGVSISGGCHDTEVEAALAYNSIAKHYCGDFAKLNEI